MRLRFMELRNYRKFRSAAIEFPDGVVAIVGQNGAGKTTLLEAVTWALFGNESSVVRDGKEGVMSAAAAPGEECSVVLEFDLDEDSYRLARSMKGKGLKVEASLEVNGNLVATGDTDVSRSVAARLGMDHKAFFVSVFAKQKDLNALANLRPAERKTLVLRMLGVDFLDEVIKEVDRDAKSAKREAEQLSALLRDEQGRDKEELLREEERAIDLAATEAEQVLLRLTEERARACEEAERAKAAWEAEEERYRRDVALERRITGLRSGLQAKRESLARLDREIADLEDLQASLPELEAKENEYHRAVQGLERQASLREAFLRRERLERDLEGRRAELGALRAESEGTERDLAGLPDLEASLSTVEASLEEVRDLATSIASQQRLAEAELARMRSSLSEVVRRTEEIERLGEEADCPTCRRPMGRQYADLLRTYGEERQALERGMGELETSLSSLEEQRGRNAQRRKVLEDRRSKFLAQSRQKASLQERSDRERRAIVDLEGKMASLKEELAAAGPAEYQLEEHERARTRVRELEPAHLALSRAQAKMERLPRARQEREGGQAVVIQEEADLAKLTEDRTALGFLPKVLQERRAAYDQARSRSGTLAEEAARAEGDMRRLGAERAALRRRREELQGVRDRHRSMMAEQDTLNRLASIMKGFKENVISRIVPTLSETSSDLLSQLTEGKYGGLRLDDDYQMYLYDQGDEHRLERFSGGETDLANLCLRLAISRMIMERSGSQMNFLVLDEIFGSQDQNRKRNILETLGQLQKQFRQILLITHIDDVKDSVSAVLRVREKEDGSSTAVLED